VVIKPQRPSPTKEELAVWVSSGLRRVLSAKNIIKDFESTGICLFPCLFDARALNSKMGPPEVYERRRGQASNADKEDNPR